MSGLQTVVSKLSKPWRFVVGAAIILLIFTFTFLYQPRPIDTYNTAPPIHGVASGDSKAASDGGGGGSSSSSTGRTQTITIDWSKFAYFQYITSEEHICQAIMIYEALERTGSKPDRLMLFPKHWQEDLDDPSKSDKKKELLLMARDKYKAKFKPIEVQSLRSADPTWAAGFTKLLAFNQTEYERVLGMDSDANVYQPMDELFFLPKATVAMPRAYWLLKDKPTFLSAQLYLVEPSAFEMRRIETAKGEKKDDDYDMEILNNLYGQSCVVIPHRKYNMLSGEFKRDRNDHALYLGSKEEVWDGKKIFAETKFLHFSDWPVPKPWHRVSDSMFEQNQPKCVQTMKRAGEDCTDRDIWRGLYTDYAKRRKEICGLDLI